MKNTGCQGFIQDFLLRGELFRYVWGHAPRIPENVFFYITTVLMLKLVGFGSMLADIPILLGTISTGSCS